MALFSIKHITGDIPYWLLPSSEEIQKVSNEDIEKVFFSLKATDRTDYLVTVIRCANKLRECASDKQKDALELAKKVVELTKSEETRVVKNDFYGPPKITLVNHLFENVVFGITTDGSKEAYELFRDAYLSST